MNLEIKDDNQLLILKEGLCWLSRENDYIIETMGNSMKVKDRNVLTLRRLYIDDLLNKVEKLLHGEEC